MLVRLVTLLALVLATVGIAQRPFVVPNYYVSQLPTLEVGVKVSGELTESDGQNYKDGARLDLYQFTGAAGQAVTLNLSSYEFDTYLSLFDPNGDLLQQNDDSDQSYYSDDWSSSVSLYLALDGKYTVVVSGYSQYDLGAYELELLARPGFSMADAPAVAVPGTISAVLTPTDPLVPDGWTGPSKGYSFELSQPVALKIDAVSSEFDTYLYLYDEDGYLLASNDDADYSEASGYATDSTLFMALKAGRYVVFVSSWDDSGGAFTLSFEEYVPRR